MLLFETILFITAFAMRVSQNKVCFVEILLLSVRVCVCVCVCVCMYVCVCLHPSTVKSSYVWGCNFREQINDVFLKTFFSSAKSLHRYLSMKNRAFLTRCLSCSHTRSEKNCDLSSFMCDSLSKASGLQLPLSSIAFGLRYIVSRSAYYLSTNERGCNLTNKS